MGEYARPSQGISFDGIHAQCLDAMKRSFAKLQFIDGRRRRSDVLVADVTRIVFCVAEPGVGFQPCPIRHVDRASRYVIDGGRTIVAKRRKRRNVGELTTSSWLIHNRPTSPRRVGRA